MSSTNAVYVPPAKRAAARATDSGLRTLVAPPTPAIPTRAAPRLTLNIPSHRRGGCSPQSSISSAMSTPYTAALSSSRPSSRSSDYSDTGSLFSAISAASSATSFAASPVRFSPVEKKVAAIHTVAGKENADGQVYVDTSRKAVMGYLYQGGKTNVLGGGVMLGSPTGQSKPRLPAASRGAQASPRGTALLSALQPRLSRV